jgi:hypothetical protein
MRITLGNGIPLRERAYTNATVLGIDTSVRSARSSAR